MTDFILKKKSRTFRGEIIPPGDKSISHRAIILGSLARGKTRASGFLASQDTLATVNAFRNMGVGVEVNSGEVEISGNGLFGLRKPGETIDAENSGTTARLLAGILSAQSFNSTITGDSSLRRRPHVQGNRPAPQYGGQNIWRGGDPAPSYNGLETPGDRLLLFRGERAGKIVAPACGTLRSGADQRDGARKNPGTTRRECSATSGFRWRQAEPTFR